MIELCIFQCLAEGLLSHIGVERSITANELRDVATAILYAAQNDGCGNGTVDDDTEHHGKGPSPYEGMLKLMQYCSKLLLCGFDVILLQ